MSDFCALSLGGPVLAGLGLAGLAIGVFVCRVTDFADLISAPRSGAAPSWRERLWVHLFVCGGWSLVFGLVVMLGPPSPAWDLRLPGEADWPVWQWTEGVYILGYLTPLVIAWIPRTRGSLLRLAWTLALLTVVSAALFLLLPIAAPPRPLVPTPMMGQLLAWEMSRPDFAAASFPSFHALWAILFAQACSDRGWKWGGVGWAWAGLMSMACVANGAHAVADVVASWLLYIMIASQPLPRWLRGSAVVGSDGDLTTTSTQATDEKAHHHAKD